MSTATAAHPPVASTELRGSGLAGVRHLREERERRRRARARRQGFTHTEVTSCRDSGSGGGGGNYDDASPRAPQTRGFPRQRRRVEDTHAYLCAKVDPVMGSLILALAADRPKNVRDAALRHLLKRRDGASPRSSTSPTASSRDGNVKHEPECATPEGDVPLEQREGNGGSHARTRVESDTVRAAHNQLAQRRDRLFMVREIGPLVTELINRTLKHMPVDVESFLIEQLQSAHPAAGGHNSTLPAEGPSDGEGFRGHLNKNYASPAATPRPSTARSRLQQAQTMDLAVQRTSPPRVERAECRSQTPPRTRHPGGEEDGDRTVADGVRESQNKPWDVEVNTSPVLCDRGEIS